MNIFDPFAGYRLSYGNSLIHLAYFIALFLVSDKSTTKICKEADYKGAKIALIVSHIVIAVFQNIGYVSDYLWKNDLFAKILDTLCLLLYHAVIFYTQSQFFQSDVTCTQAHPNLHSWFMVEIITFYFLIFSVVIYLMLASIWKIKRISYYESERTQYFENDFLEWTNDVYYYFGLSLTLLCVSVTIYIQEKDMKCGPNKSTYMPTLITVITIHVLQCVYQYFHIF